MSLGPRLKVKPGVDLNNLQPEIIRTIVPVMELIHLENVEPVITSGTDGTHSPNSLHYKGLALDWRTRDLPQGSEGEIARTLALKIQGTLGDDYDVVLEKTHIHIEYDPD